MNHNKLVGALSFVAMIVWNLPGHAQIYYGWCQAPQVLRQMHDMKGQLTTRLIGPHQEPPVVTEMVPPSEDAGPANYTVTFKPSSSCSCISTTPLTYSAIVTVRTETDEYGGGAKVTTKYYVGQLTKNDQCLPCSAIFWITVTPTGNSGREYVWFGTLLEDNAAGVEAQGDWFATGKGPNYAGDFFGFFNRGGVQCYAANHQVTVTQ